MKREELIAYSFYYGGEYNKVYQAIKENKKIAPLKIDNAVTILDDHYPRAFLDLKYPPFVFYYYGDLGLFNKQIYGIVGSRDPCPYALEATMALAMHYSDKVIVSGLAKGIDAHAHRYAAKTIGVLGCGIDYIYPYCNKELIENVKRNGLVISEYPSMCKPYACHFPFRNRLIAALSERLYVMQSSRRSGTMTSVNEALELGKEVHVLPYDVFSKEGAQNNTLIYEGGQPILNEEIAF
ncbi:MAG: DNA-protecting protein DprA [Erysipelotrichaceae bacterium]|nr:DNA-protecting protein DprA [Erysipelotrichaceae bacterium]MBQ2080040.1 DNA-protecting protein DprA [Erysipelotrichaceae bacterium]